MKARNTLIVIGIILILFNAISYLGENSSVHQSDATNQTAYLIGRNMFFIVGIILLLISFFVHRNVIRKKKKGLIDSLLEDSEKK